MPIGKPTRWPTKRWTRARPSNEENRRLEALPRVNPRGNLFVVTGPSGSGKDEVISLLRRNDPQLRMATTAVTREPRPGELAGVNHHFLTQAEFERWEAEGKLLEWAEVYGRRYGTPRREVVGPVNGGQDVVLRVDAQGARSVKEKLPDAVLIFIAPPSAEEMRKRLESRATEASAEIDDRLEYLDSEMAFSDECDYVVVNATDGQAQAARELGEIIQSVRRKRRKGRSVISGEG